MPEITKGEVERAEAALIAAKKAKGPGAAQALREAAQNTADLRRAWREQEVAAGRRRPGVGVSTGRAGDQS